MPAARGMVVKKRSDATREALLDAATELFARRGFDGASVERCPPMDIDGDLQVTIDELLVAVEKALNGCS